MFAYAAVALGLQSHACPLKMHAKHMLTSSLVQDSGCSSMDADVRGTVNGMDSDGFSISGPDRSIEDFDEEVSTSQ